MKIILSIKPEGSGSLNARKMQERKNELEDRETLSIAILRF
jgi:hypothetical protein